MRGIFISFLVNLVVFSALGQDFESHQLFVRIKMDKALSVTEFEKEFLNNNVQYSSVIPVFKTKELQNIFLVTLFENEKLEKSIEILSRNTLIDYVEKVPIYKFFYTPNDPQYASQWNLSKIKADLAWNINQGNNQIKIAVTDDGFLLTHQDLASQWAINSGEIVGNGIDDDNNGYIDDWRGWDAADNDNDPSAFNASNTYFTHGTHVSGIVGAATNNSIGIGSISFNCKIIPVKIGTNSNGSLFGAYQGLEYAINTDARVINMSWGGAAYSATYQLLFNLAKSKGIVCVAAAGNSSSSIPMYPASYNNVISVASTFNTDGLSSFSNYGSTIDVCAPGSSILSTLAGSTSSYGNLSGTSMASPLVAGLCGLMISNNPSLIPDSVEACLKRTCDNINAQNTSRIGQIGAGRINAYQALLCTQKAPIANFTTNFSSQCTGKPVQYLSTSAGNMPMTYSWSFPGGTPSTSTQMNPSVTYNTNGLKTATLTVTNSLGTDTKTISNIVNITSPTATLSGNVSVYGSSTAYLTINFTGNPPFSVTLTDGTNTFTKNNITQNPYFFPIIPLKDTSNIVISAFSDSMCVGNYSGSGVVYKKSGVGNIVKNDTFSTSVLCTFDGDVSNYSANLWEFDRNYLIVGNWTISGSPYTWESILKFDLSKIPKGATINSAQLSLTADKTAVGWGIPGKPTYSSPNNSVFIRRVSSTFEKNNPSSYPVSTTTLNQVSIPASTSDTQNYPNIDVKNLIQDIVASGQNNGIIIEPQIKSVYNSFVMCSGNFPDISKRPRLIVNYSYNGNQEVIDNCKSCALNDGLVLHLPFNGNTLDVSGKGNHATNYGATAVAGKDGVANTAYRFNGSSNYMKVTANSTLSKGGLKTIMMLYQPKGFFQGTCHGNQIIYSGTDGNGLGIRYSDRMVNSNHCSTPPDSLNENFYAINGWVGSPQNTPYYPRVTKDTWYCLALIQDSFFLKMYVNGVLVGKENNAYNSNTGIDDWYIGKNSISSFFANGVIDDIRIYNRALDSNEIKAYCGTCEVVNIPTVPCDTSTLDNGLMLHLPFDGNTLDASGNGNHAINYGATAVAGKDGVANTAYRFNGSSNYMEITNSSSLNPTSSITITSIIKLDAHNPTPGWFASNILSKSADNSIGNINLRITNGIWNVADTNNSFFVGDFNKTSYQLPSNYLSILKVPQYVQTNSWYCVVYTFDGDSCRMYINGKLKWSIKSNDNSLISSASGIRIGRSYNNSPDQYYFNGLMDDIRIYNRAITSDEVKAYCGTCEVVNTPTVPCDTTTLDNGLMLHLPFNGNTLDASGNGNHATNYGATAVAGKDGVANTAYKFNGSSNYMLVQNSTSLNINTNLTLTAIVKVDGFYTSGSWFANSIIAKGVDGPGAYLLRFTNDLIYNPSDTNYFFYGQFNNDGSANYYNTLLDQPEYIKKGTWYCLVYTFDGDTCRMYINGNLKWKFKSNSNNIYTDIQNLAIGKALNSNTNFSYFLNGVIDDIRIYNRTITSDEVKAYCGTCEVVNTPTPCDTTTLDNGLIAYYPLDGNANDLSGNGNHGTAYGGLQYISGKRGLAANYDGIDDYINLNKKLLSGLNDFTITGWTYLNQALAHPKSFNIYRENNAGWNGSGLDVTISNFNLSKYTLQAGWSSYKGISMQNFVVRDDNIDSGRWYCFTVTRKQGYLKLYLGGVLIQTVLDSFTTSPLNNGILGGWWFNNDPSQIGFSKGYLDDIRFYNRALDSNEIKAYCGTCEVGNTKCPNTFSKIILKKCNNDSIILSANNGNSYVWSPNQGLSNNMIKSPVCFTKNNMVYKVSYTDSLNCQHIDTVVVSVKPKINFNPIPDQLICIGDSTQFLIPISGNNITWTPNVEINNNTIKNPIVYPSQNRTYSVEFKDSLGCSQSDSVAISLKKCCNDRASFTIIDSLLCHPDSINIVNTSKNLITPKFSWFFGNAIPSQYTGVKPPKVFFNSYSDYIINLILDNGTCQDTFSKKIYVLKTPAYAGKDSSFCKSQVIDFPLGESGLSELLYSWIPTDGLDNPNISNPNLTTQKSNTYILKVYSPETKCFAYDTVRIQVNENVPLEIIPSHINHVETNVEVTLTAKGRNYYMWHNGINSNTIKYVARADSTFYVIGYSDSICFDTAYYRVLIKKPYFIGFPSAFSPNNDGVNELFKPNFYGEVEDINFSIYSKWGEKIFEGEGTNAGWNGYYKGELIEVGTYVYVLRYRIYGKNELKKGSFVLIK